MLETPVWKDVLRATSQQVGCVLFRNNVGMGWVGDIVKRTRGLITLRTPRPLHAGLIKGSGDGIGWQTVTITPDMVGREVAIFLSVETKAPVTGRLKTEQKTWRENVDAAGGIAIVARSETEFLDGLCLYLRKLRGFD